MSDDEYEEEYEQEQEEESSESESSEEEQEQRQEYREDRQERSRRSEHSYHSSHSNHSDHSDHSDHSSGHGGGGYGGHSSGGGLLGAIAGGGGHGSSRHGSGGGSGGMLGGLVKGFAKLAAKDKEKQDSRSAGVGGNGQYDYQQQGHQQGGYPQQQQQQQQQQQGYSEQGYQQQNQQQGFQNQQQGYQNQGDQSYAGGNYGQRDTGAGAGYPQQGFNNNAPGARGMQYYGPSTQDAHGNVVQHSFQWSRCTGKKKALLIGINYFGQEGELAGCINDAHNVRRFIIERFGYRPEDIVMLLDDSKNPREIPTRANIVSAMQWLVRDAQPDDSLVVHYSGHGTSVEDTDGDEHDDCDEAICPLDYKGAGMIVDDERTLPFFAQLTISGTVLDLPFVYNTKGAIKEPDLINENEILKAGLAYLQGDSGSAFSMFKNIAKDAFGAHNSNQKALKTKTSPAGCKDAQTSADTSEAGKATGAMSWAFITSLTENHTQSYQELLNSVRDLLESQYSQTVQMSSSHPMDMSLQFVA